MILKVEQLTTILCSAKLSDETTIIPQCEQKFYIK